MDRAARLAHQAGASLTLVHAVDASMLNELRQWLDSDGDVGRSILDDARVRLHDLAAEIAARDRIDVDPRLVSGRAVDEIARIAAERGADLIVTGTLGGGLFRYHLLGSTAERVVKKSALPVLLVRQASHEAHRRVLVPIDFSRWSAPALDFAIAVAPDAHFLLAHCVLVPFEGSLRLAGVDGSVIERHRAAAQDEAWHRLAELARGSGLSEGRWTAFTPAGVDPWMGIVRLEQEQDCDLIVIGKHGRNVVEEFFVGSTTNMVIAESACDVLVSARAGAP